MERNNRESNHNEPFQPVNRKVKSTRKQIIVMSIWIIVCIVLICQVVQFIGYTIGKVDKSKMHVYNAVDAVIQKVIKKKPSTTTEEKTLKVAALGNMYVTPNILSGAKSGNAYDFVTGSESVASKLKDFDYVLASLNTPIVDKTIGYSTTKSYGAPVELTKLLTSLHVTHVATATSHAMDKNIKGMTATLANLKEAGIEQTGLSESGRTKPVILSKNDIKIGMLSYATSTITKVDKSLPDALNILTEENIKDDMAYLKENQVDQVIAYLDVPDATSTIITAKQKENVDLLFDQGVNIVLGSGVAYVQDDYEDEIELADENKTKSHIYASYSLGDLMGSFTDTQSSIIPNFEFTKTITKNKKGEVIKTQNDVKMKAPLMVWTSVSKTYATTMSFMEDEVKAYQNDTSKLTAKEYNAMKKEYDRIIKLYE